MHPHTKQQLAKFKEKFWDDNLIGSVELMLYRDIEEFIQQALLSQAEYIRAEMVPEQREPYHRVQSREQQEFNAIVSSFNYCRSYIATKLDELINSFK